MRRASARKAAPAARLGEHVPLTPGNVAVAPALPGVYLLYRGHRLIYIGVAPRGATIRGRLREHLLGGGAGGTGSATEFDYEVSGEPFALYGHYLAVYIDTTGGLLPDCNELDERGNA
jgi:hypothetical protein